MVPGPGLRKSMSPIRNWVLSVIRAMFRFQFLNPVLRKLYHFSHMQTPRDFESWVKQVKYLTRIFTHDSKSRESRPLQSAKMLPKCEFCKPDPSPRILSDISANVHAS